MFRADAVVKPRLASIDVGSKPHSDRGYHPTTAPMTVEVFTSDVE